MVKKERYRIQGKIYYKESEEPVNYADKMLVDAIWKMTNPKGEAFRLIIRSGNHKCYTLYDCNTDKRIARTYSIAKVVTNANN